MTRDDERPSSVMRLKSMESDRYFVADEPAGFRAAARRISWTRRKLALRADFVTYEFSMVGFERVWPELKRWCALPGTSKRQRPPGGSGAGSTRRQLVGASRA
jgi:hypothetical protein